MKEYISIIIFTNIDFFNMQIYFTFRKYIKSVVYYFFFQLSYNQIYFLISFIWKTNETDFYYSEKRLRLVIELSIQRNRLLLSTEKYIVTTAISFFFVSFTFQSMVIKELKIQLVLRVTGIDILKIEVIKSLILPQYLIQIFIQKIKCSLSDQKIKSNIYSTQSIENIQLFNVSFFLNIQYNLLIN